MKSQVAEKIILYYKFIELSDPETTMKWQRELCDKLNLTGRIIVSKQGINGTLGGRVEDLKAYIKENNQHTKLKKIAYKWSDGGRKDFPKLSVKVREELVTLDADNEFDVFNSSRGLKPEEWHNYLLEHPEVLVLDARNDYESEIGVFDVKNLIAPKIKAFREIKKVLEDIPKDQTVLTYCTGDVRCEYLSAYMQDQGFKDVYHLDGGIVKYGQKFGDDGLWLGKCYVFDDRMNLAFSEKSKDIGKCLNCESKTSNYVNCSDIDCNKLQLMCEKCFNNDIKCNYCESYVRA